MMKPPSAFLPICLFILVALIGLTSSRQALAQGPEAAPAVSSAGTAVRDANAYPPVPGGFYRGSHPSRPELRGFYFHNVMLVYLLGLFVLWVWTANWIDTDAHDLKVRPLIWNSVVLLSGVSGFVLALCAPSGLLSFLAMTAGYGIPLGIYASERNKRVPDSAKILTPRHLKSVALRTLARMGVKLNAKEARSVAGGPPIRLIGKSGKGAGEVDRSRQVESSSGYIAARELIYDAILRRTTDIHLEPKEGEMSVRLRIDGVMYPAEPFDRSTGDALVNIFKVLSAMDITERRKPQDGSFRAEMEGRTIDFRVATQGLQGGEKMVIRILDKGATAKTLVDLGMRKQLVEQMQSIVSQPHGMFLTCGPTGAGKSTTLYAALQEINAYENNIITVEDPVEYRMPNVTQIEINSKAGQTFATALRSILRQDPDVVMIGEIRDGETAKISCQAANTGHMVFSTIHANDTIAALFRLIDLEVEPFLLASSISAILGQRLVRKLCQDCKEAYKPSADLLQKIGLPADKVDKFFRPPTRSQGTCPSCNGLGYVGRVGVFELLVINDRLRDLIRESPNMSAIKAEARKNGMLYMKEEGLRLVVKGTTSIEELQRVVK
ncbi:GspE/PulE family protein [Schlesneria sp. DSM 10557]|uniref:GspE/PulE family protein n=1 Tax=Schlesneria sp. DSM 10557 TaxID=3044399 RepID=UPI0035A118B6